MTGNCAPDEATSRAKELRQRVLTSLGSQGFTLEADRLVALPVDCDKAAIRLLHREAVMAAKERARPRLLRHESRLLQHFAHGHDVEPERIRPVLKIVRPDTDDELLFRYARLQWSIPVSAGYGRRLRFLVFDNNTGKLMGLIGLGDPVFQLRSRDSWIGWDKAGRRERLRHVMDAFVLGAVPPYSYLLCGKLIASLLASDEVREAFAKKYGGTTSVITGRQFDGRLALITTASALGRSSLYNRIRFGERKLFISAGFTSGSGEFHFSNGIYPDLLDFARSHCAPTAKHERWGNGWRSRRELVRSVLPQLGLSRELVYHGIRREIFVVPLAENVREFLQGDDAKLITYPMSAGEISSWFKERWLLPRASRDMRYRDFDPESLRLWDKPDSPR